MLAPPPASAQLTGTAGFSKAVSTRSGAVLPSLLQTVHKKRMHPALVKVVECLCGCVSLLVSGGESIGLPSL